MRRHKTQCEIPGVEGTSEMDEQSKAMFDRFRAIRQKQAEAHLALLPHIIEEARKSGVELDERDQECVLLGMRWSDRVYLARALKKGDKPFS